MRHLVKQLLPPLVTNWLHQMRTDRAPAPGAITFSGNYASWPEALRDSAGYDSPVILERTRDALRKVRDGEAVSERDSVLLPVPEWPLFLLVGVLRAAAEKSAGLHILDFGGSLGSSYFQCRPLLAALPGLRWSVVEQPGHVACGQREFADGRLQFFNCVEDCLATGRPDVLLLSSVVQYLPAPHEFLARMVAHGFPWIVIDRTAFHAGPRDRLTVQRVPESIYPATYPAWFFAEAGWQEHFRANYQCLATGPALDRPELAEGRAWSSAMIYRRQ